MKKLTAVILALIFAASAAACGTGGSSNEQGGVSTVDLSGEIGGEITVSCYDTMRYKSFLEDAAKLFEEKYPSAKVSVETFSAMPETRTSEQGGKKMSAVFMQDDPQGRADYINKINTSLMGGEGADILAMDVLPFYKYADAGQLENLSFYMDSDPGFNRSDYRQNILGAAMYQGGIWFLPIDYSFTYYAYDSTLLADAAAYGFGTGGAFTAEQLAELAKPSFNGEHKLFNETGYAKGVNTGLFGRILREGYSSFVDVENKKANFADGRFAGLLESVTEYAQEGYINKSVTGGQDTDEMMKHSEEAPADRYFFKPKNSFMLTQQYNKDSGRKMMIMASGTGASIDTDDEVAGIAADSDGSVPFTFEQAFGVNANSKNKQTAWAFLKFLLSEEMQVSTSLSATSLPLNNSAREQKAGLVLSGAFMGRGEPLDDKQREVLKKYTDAIEQLSDLINSYTVRDTTVDDMIAAEVQYFFDGTKSADDVAKVLQNKIELYLSE